MGCVYYSLFGNGNKRMDNAPLDKPEDLSCQGVDVVNAKAEISLRNRALTLSANAIYILIGAHIVFAYLGKTLPFPEIIWAVVLAPWLGAAGGKVSGILDDLLSKEKK